MGKADDEGKALLREFGEDMIRNFNWALNKLERSLTGDHISDQVFRDYLKSLPELDRSLKVAQMALETFMHDLMASFEESKKFRIVAEDANGAFHDLKMFSEFGLHFEQIEWQEEFGKHGSVGDVILSLMEIAEERAGKKSN